MSLSLLNLSACRPLITSSGGTARAATATLSADRVLLCPRIIWRGVKAGWYTGPKRGAKPLNYNLGSGLPQLTQSPDAALARLDHSLPRRSGVLAIKKGMTALYNPETGRRTACTVLQMDRVQVVAHKTREQHGYYAVQVGSGWKPADNVTRPLLGYFAHQAVSPKRHLVEFRVRDATGLPDIGHMLAPDWFKEGQFVDTRSASRGMGFAGGMKRHNFKGQPASHGNSKTHRAMGSAGASQGGGSRVLPGKRMAGRMGGNQVTIQNVKVLKTDIEKGILVLNGCIAGPKGSLVQIQDAIKKSWPTFPPNTTASSESTATV
ncbi:BgTH12-07878 [Blumeria graminis f. sp. triticale]|uniref:Large ribosomal subunit protein uL3m n=3 Tax=Blumeria graminis TaxID=34373 RepID=A0A061HHF3_BLUGR|nr:Mitochondrial ribosomal [Blumeria graminis f. sp. tritici 96224]CAD6499475.1 BgTH12-07878 [Blumeria graminis f. sp. triticale]VCU39641.1 Bgt-2997 [Blumeria graminis f. sp. tritici]